jgi:ABC-2 type transport system permease protein
MPGRSDTAPAGLRETARTPGARNPGAARAAAAAAVRGRRPLGLWRLEVLRVVRTKRWLLLFIAYPVLGAAGPIVVRHLDAILSALGADGVDAPDDIDADTPMTAYIGVSGQIGLLVALGMCAAAMSLDHRPGLAAFYRTRTRRTWQLVLPRWTVCAAAVCIANLVASLIVWAEIRWLFGPVRTELMLYAILFTTVYLLMALGVVAGAAAVLRRPVAVFGTALVALVLSPLPRLWKPLRGWSPDKLSGAGIELLDGSAPGSYAGPAAVAVVLTGVLLTFSVWRIGRREM